MSELFGISANKEIRLNEQLSVFFSKGKFHPDGWGLACFRKYNVSIEKEPVSSTSSRYLRQRLLAGITADHLIAHLRDATRGEIMYENCQPFSLTDCTGRTWTLAHSGTIFDFDALSRYVPEQDGTSDSERILFYFIDQVRQVTNRMGKPLSPEERFRLLDASIGFMSRENKLILLIYDGEVTYAHTNYRDSLFMLKEEDAVFFSTTRPDSRPWEPVPLNTLIGCVGGTLVYTGRDHHHEYLNEEEKERLLYMDYAFL
ncbi:MAG: class II glutamine amidotransferase [Lachnospiraceae bacterium]|nr:class II glutamine amidotransferase [Lachnospiraceae bacterium]